MLWFGTLLLDKNKTDNQKTLGFSIVCASMPIMRLLNPIGGGCDEVVFLDHFLNNHNLSRMVATLLILAIITYPLYRCYKVIENKYKVGWFLMFFLLSTAIGLMVVVGLMNTLLKMVTG